jgi:hypothetical protein
VGEPGLNKILKKCIIIKKIKIMNRYQLYGLG